MTDISIEQVFILLITAFVAGIFIFMKFFGEGTSSNSYWENLIKFAIKNNASNLLIEKGNSPKMKVDDEWRNINIPTLDAEEMYHLKSILQSQSDAWIIGGVGLAQVVREEENTIEWELKPGQY